MESLILPEKSNFLLIIRVIFNKLIFEIGLLSYNTFYYK